MDLNLTRRRVIFGLGSLSLVSGCSHVGDIRAGLGSLSSDRFLPQIGFDRNVTGDRTMYAAVADGPFDLPAVPYQKVPSRFRRKVVKDPTGEAPGTIVVSTTEHSLYLVQPGGDAIRYGVGIGKAGFEWSGRAVIQYKKEWPRWTPPQEMIARLPDLAQYANGQEGGLTNPLGARALYIFKDGQDTFYRVHGSPEWWSIGKSMSSGCIRLINQDIIDLYDRVPNGSPIIVA